MILVRQRRNVSHTAPFCTRRKVGVYACRRVFVTSEFRCNRNTEFLRVLCTTYCTIILTLQTSCTVGPQVRYGT